MFGFGKPRCPVDPVTKSWIERRLIWLGEQFGRDLFLRRAVMLPTADFFPGRYDGKEEGIRNLYEQVCERMGVNPVLLPITFQRFPDHGLHCGGHEVGKPAALYRGSDVAFDIGHGADPATFVATLAHELSHHRLMGENRLSGEEFDNELLTDLTAMFFGFGVFLANSPRVWVSGFRPWPGSTLMKPEYMTPPMHGYVLAHRAWILGEEKPAWAKFLHGEARGCFQSGLRYLTRTGDSRFGPEERERRLASR